LFNQILKEAMGISDQAAEAFRVLLTVGPLTIGEISTYSGLGYALASKAMLELEHERLIRRIPSAVERYATVPPYAGFVAFLKDFQKIAKNIGDNANSVVDSTLTAITHNCEDWKKEAQQATGSSIVQTVGEIDSFKESSSKSVSDTLEKVKQDTELTRNMVNDAIKKHVDEHTAKSNEVEEELASGITNVATKFDASAKKYLKEVTDMTSTFLENYKSVIKNFVETMQTSLQDYRTKTRESLTLMENDISSIQSKLEEKARTTVANVKTKGSDTVENQRKTFSDKSLELQSGIREATDRFMKTSSTNLSKFKSSIDTIMKQLSNELNKIVSGFNEKTVASLGKWGSRFKTDINDCNQSVHKTVDTLVDSLTRELEKTNSFAQGLIESFVVKTKSSFGDLKGRIGEVYSSGMANLTGAVSAIRGTLEGIINSHLSSCQLMTSFLESASSTMLAGASSALDSVEAKVDESARDAMLRVSKKNYSLLSEMTVKATSKISSSFPALEKEFNKVVEKVLTSTAPSPATEQPPRTKSHKSAKGAVKRAPTAGIRGDFKVALKNLEKGLIDEIREHLKEEAKAGHASFDEEARKAQAEIKKAFSSSLKSAKSELGKGSVVASSLLPRFAEYTSSVDNLSKQVTDLVNASVKQYAGESDIANKALDDLLSRQEEILDSILRQVPERLSEQKSASAKELGDLAGGAHSTLDTTVNKHLDELDAHIQESKSTLLETVAQVAKTIDGASSSTQTSITNQITPILNTSKEITESTTNSIRGAMTSVANSFDKVTTSLQKDLSDFVIQSTDEMKSFTEESIGKLSESKDSVSTEIDQIINRAAKELNEISGKQVKDMLNTTSTMSTSLSNLTNSTIEGFASEAAGAKERFHRIISTDLQNYTQGAIGTSGTCGYLLTRSYEKYREVSMVNEKKLTEIFLTHQSRYENAIKTMNSNLIGVIDKSEALLRQEDKKILANFRDNIDKLKKASGSVEWVLQNAWMELEKAPQLAAEKTWNIVGKAAVMTRIQDMVKRTRSHIVIAFPTLLEAPLMDIAKVKKATRVTLLVPAKKHEQKDEQMLRELSKSGNITVRVSPDLPYFGCSKDSEEVLLAPMTQKDNELVGVASTQDEYTQLFDKIVLPALLAPSYDFKESTEEKPVSKATEE